jgi:uncharacterized membrane protein (UPF0127 family)
MRDCPIPIDIMFVDATGRITAIHEMKPEPPRTEEEKKLTIPAGGQPWQGYNAGYEDRLTRYHSKFSAQYAIELAGGAIRKLGLAENQKLDLDPQLKKWAK